MATDDPVKETAGSPCCAVWQEKYAKVLESRNKLRQAVKDSKILLLQLDRIRAENIQLKKALDEDRVATEKDGKEKEMAMRFSLEKEISALKTEIESLQEQKQGPDCEDRSFEVELFQGHVAEGEKEISKLKDLLEKEKERAGSDKKNAETAMKKREKEISKLKDLLEKEKTRANSEKKKADVDKKWEKEISKVRELLAKEKTRADLEKKNAEIEKKKAADTLKHLNDEMSKAEKERRLSRAEGVKADDYKMQLEALKKEAERAKADLVSKTSMFEEVNEKLEAEKQMVIKERKHADAKKKKAEMQKKLAKANKKIALEEKSRSEKLSQQLDEANKKIKDLQKEICKQPEMQKNLAEPKKKKASEEKSRSENLSQQLEEAKQKIEELHREFYELVSRNFDEASLDQGNKSLNAEATHMKKRLWLGVLNKNPDELKLALEFLKLEEANARSEIEKQNVPVEKKRADLELVKAAERRQLAAVWEKTALDEKCRADQLSLQLGKSRRMIEQLQKQLCDLSSFRDLPNCGLVYSTKYTTESLSVKLLKNELEIEKSKGKHFREVAKLEKSRNSILQEELGQLKQDFVQYSNRLDVLHKCFSICGEGTYDEEKAEDFVNLQTLKLKENTCTLEPFCNNESLKPIIENVSDPRMQIFRPTAPGLPICGGCCNESMSGINSQLESLIGGSSPKMLLSSAINSSMASFSDGQFVGSQGRGSLSATPSTKLIEGNLNLQPTRPSLSGEVNKMNCIERCTILAENGITAPLGADVGVERNDMKRKWMNHESIGSLYSKRKKHVQEKCSLLHNMLNSHVDEPSDEAKLQEFYLLGDSDSHDEDDRLMKKRKMHHEERGMEKDLYDIGELKIKEAETKILDNTYVFEQATERDNNIAVSEPALRKSSDDAIARDGFVTENFEGMRHLDQEIDRNCMKLLGLDNAMGEECDKKALEVPLSPLSPTLLELNIQEDEMFVPDNSKPSPPKGFCQGLSNNTDLLPSCNFDIINVDTDTNKLSLHEDEALVSFDKLKDSGKLNALECKGERGVSSDFVSMDEGIKVSCDSGCSRNLSIPEFCIVFSDIKDSNNISSMFCTTSRLAQHLLSIERDWIMHKILRALKKEVKLSSRERVCVFFSLLLLNFFAVNLECPASFLDNNFISCSNSFTAHVSTVMSDVEARSAFMELCLEELLCLIEDFLIHGRVMEYTDETSQELIECRSGTNFDCLNLMLSSKPASVGHLIFGSILLSSICVAVNHIGFIFKASYNILRRCRHDASAMLTILHVFAFVGVERYITPKEHSLTMAVVKSTVTFLESETVSSCPLLASGFHGDCNLFNTCPFSENAISMDVIASLVLEKLQSYANSGVIDQNLMHWDDTQQISGHGDAQCVLDMNCDPLCFLKQASGTLCHFVDALSMLELLACKMSWKWTCERIVHRLLKILESSLQSNVSVPVVILLGQLGRLGVDAAGYEDKEVENLRSALSSFLMRDTISHAGLPFQNATINALLGLLSVDFEQAVHQSDSNLLANTSDAFHSGRVREWFSMLSKEQQDLSLSLLQISDETTS